MPVLFVTSSIHVYLEFVNAKPARGAAKEKVRPQFLAPYGKHCMVGIRCEDRIQPLALKVH